MILLEIFWSFVQIGLCTVGGGLSAISLIQKIIVYGHNWISLEEFADIITISELTPGPIAINAATFAGMKVQGTLGATVACIGFIVPTFVIVLALGYFYYRYKNLDYIKGILQSVRPSIVAITASAGISIFYVAVLKDNKEFNICNIDYVNFAIFIIGLYVLVRYEKKVNSIFVMLSCGILGTVFHLLFL